MECLAERLEFHQTPRHFAASEVETSELLISTTVVSWVSGEILTTSHFVVFSFRHESEAKEFITVSCLHTESSDLAVVRRSSVWTAAPRCVPRTMRPHMLSHNCFRSKSITVRNRVGGRTEPCVTPREREELDK